MCTYFCQFFTPPPIPGLVIIRISISRASKHRAGSERWERLRPGPRAPTPASPNETRKPGQARCWAGESTLGLTPAHNQRAWPDFFFFGFGSGVGFLFRTRPVLCSGRKKKRNRNPVGYRVGLSLVLQCSGLNIRLHRYSCRPI